ncbi:hypothetical protein, partial [Salmonella enterica]|uniref:hypothetical protein n=1 Tax=Salmonella enterica TaxID=28901 RepID=UPI0020C3806D
KFSAIKKNNRRNKENIKETPPQATLLPKKSKPFYFLILYGNPKKQLLQKSKQAKKIKNNKETQKHKDAHANPPQTQPAK